MHPLLSNTRPPQALLSELAPIGSMSVTPSSSMSQYAHSRPEEPALTVQPIQQSVLLWITVPQGPSVLPDVGWH